MASVFAEAKVQLAAVTFGSDVITFSLQLQEVETKNEIKQLMETLGHKLSKESPQTIKYKGQPFGIKDNRNSMLAVAEVVCNKGWSLVCVTPMLRSFDLYFERKIK